MFGKNQKLTCLATLVLVSSAPVAVAEDTAASSSKPAATAATSSASPDQAAKVALIKELLDVSRANRNAQLGYDTVIDQQMRGLHAAMDERIERDTKLTPDQKKETKRLMLIRLNRRMARTKELMQQRINMTELVSEAYVKLYDKYFTTAEIKDMVVWYKSPTAQKVLDVLPPMTAEMIKMVNAAIMPKLQDLDQQLAKEDAEGKFDDTHP